MLIHLRKQFDSSLVVDFGSTTNYPSWCCANFRHERLPYLMNVRCELSCQAGGSLEVCLIKDCSVHEIVADVCILCVKDKRLQGKSFSSQHSFKTSFLKRRECPGQSPLRYELRAKSLLFEANDNGIKRRHYPSMNSTIESNVVLFCFRNAVFFQACPSNS